MGNDAYRDFLVEKKMTEVTVPSDDKEVMKMLRKLNQPICLFGEDAFDRVQRLRRYIVDNNFISDFVTEEEEIKEIPKFEEGSEKISEMKRKIINFSIPRSYIRLKNEREVTEERIKDNNNQGLRYKDFELTATDTADRRLTCVCYKNPTFALGTSSGNVSVWSLDSMENLFNLKSSDMYISGLTYINDNLLACCSPSKSVKIWKDDELISSIDMDRRLYSVCSHPLEPYILIGDEIGYINVLDVETSEVIVSMKSTDGTTTSISAHEDGAVVFAGGADFVGRLWDLRSCNLIKNLVGHKERILSSCFNGYICITGSVDSYINVWDMRNLARSKKVAIHSGPVTSVCSKDDLFFSCSMDKHIKVSSLLDFRNYASISDIVFPISGMSLTEEGIITSCSDGNWRYLSSPLF